MIGKTISHYKILSKLGEGGMGVVYKAEDLTLGRTVALKFLPPDSVATEDDRTRLVHEARAAAALLHPNICPVYEIAEAEGRIFIAMACIEGRSLKDRIAEGPVSLDEALSIARQIGDALAAAHGKGIIHRDIKPGNVMLLPDGRPMLMDFGLAKVAGTTKLTRTGTTMGTVAYMSPEQVKGVGADARSDIWALGVVLYEMVSGRAPFGGEYEAALLYSILNEDPVPLAGEGTDIPAGLDGIIAKALAKDPARRYQKAEEFVADVRMLAQDSEALPAGKARPAKGLRRLWRSWLPWQRAAAVGALVIVIAGLVWAGLKFWPGRAEAMDSIGILPLANLSGDPSKDIWAEGVTEQLSSCMGTIGSLRIISDQTMKQFKGSNEPLPVIGRQVGVKALITGSLMLVGDQITITAKLFDAAKDRMIWSNTFSGEPRDIMILQSRIAREVAGALKARLTATNDARLAVARSADPMAYELYLQGRQFLVNWKLKEAEECYRRAVAMDSTLAAAWAGLANAYTIQAFSGVTPAQVAPLARAALTKALALDDQLAETQAALGSIRLNWDWDWAGADAATKRAVELNPNNTEILMQRKLVLYAANRVEEAIEIQRRICDLQPLEPSAIGDMGWMSFYGRRYDDAIAHFRKSDEMSGYHGPNAMVAMSYYLKGMYKEALAECDANPNPGFQEAFIYAKLGSRDRATAYLAAKQLEWDAGKRWNLCDMAALNAGLGKKDDAFAWLRKGLEERWPEMLQFPTEPYLDDLRSDPRWQELLELIHYPKSKS